MRIFAFSGRKGSSGCFSVCILLFVAVTFVAYTFYHIIYRVHAIAIGEFYCWNLYIFKAVCMLALFAIEVYVHVVELVVALSVAELILQGVTAILYTLYQAML